MSAAVTPIAWPVRIAALISLALLLAHASVYRFLTDDAFISFRYARHLATGHGLVFNAGYERVEGYTNFLWVLVLAAFQKLGFAPEHASLGLGFALTVALWALVARAAFRARLAPAWLAVVPLFLLAATRSVAVWSTSGLETRLFEVCVVSALLRLAHEVGALRSGATPRAWSPWLFGLAALTRPEGLVISVSAFAAACALLRTWRRPLAPFVRGWLPFVALAGGHLAFRRLYYGEWVPNTYWAKVGGHAWWTSGLRYLAAFGFEYGAFLWIPPLVLAVRAERRAGRGWRPLLVAGALVPYVVGVVAIGGDHFEYRPLDVLFPFAFLAVGLGLGAWLAVARRLPLLILYVLVLFAGLVDLPLRSHLEFPRGYRSGFPGLDPSPEGKAFLDPGRDPLAWVPTWRSIGAVHRRLLDRLSSQFVGLRQEEHRAFLAYVMPEARRLDRLVRNGVLPRDAYVAMDCVGAIPYYSGLRTLDRLGLTDARVARSEVTRPNLMAHGKVATIDYGRERGVELWPVDRVLLCVDATSTTLFTCVAAGGRGDPAYWAADVGDGTFLLARLPLGPDVVLQRMPGLGLKWTGDTAFVARYAARAIPAYSESLVTHPSDAGLTERLAFLHLVRGEYEPASRSYAWLTDQRPDDESAWEYLGLSLEGFGDRAAAAKARDRALALATARGDEATIARLREQAAAAGAATGR